MTASVPREQTCRFPQPIQAGYAPIRPARTERLDNQHGRTHAAKTCVLEVRAAVGAVPVQRGNLMTYPVSSSSNNYGPNVAASSFTYELSGGIPPATGLLVPPQSPTGAISSNVGRALSATQSALSAACVLLAGTTPTATGLLPVFKG